MWDAEEGRVTVTDLNSTNGTYINETELEPMKTTDIPLGAEVTFGKTLYLLTGHEPQTPGKEHCAGRQVKDWLGDPNAMHAPCL